MPYLLALAALLAGAIAAVAAFGIGSILTPLMTTLVSAKLAVASVSIPHFLATAYRFWLIREHVDRRVLLSFGVMSAAGGLVGALLDSVATARTLELVLASLLLFVGVAVMFGWNKRIRFQGPWAWIAGGVSGFLGGLVGNQGGLRAGAMTGLGVSRDAFVATATATGLIVDAARMPIYIAGRWQGLVALWPYILLMVVGVSIGTLVGTAVLHKIPEAIFLRVVSVLLLALSLWLFLKR